MKTVNISWGSVRIKIGKFNGKVIQISPEYEDCKKIAYKEKVPVKQVYEEAHSQAIKLFGTIDTPLL
jgi:hypothetical protein